MRLRSSPLAPLSKFWDKEMLKIVADPEYRNGRSHFAATVHGIAQEQTRKSRGLVDG